MQNIVIKKWYFENFQNNSFTANYAKKSQLEGEDNRVDSDLDDLIELFYQDKILVIGLEN